jgi:hypothetical protein
MKLNTRKLFLPALTFLWVSVSVAGQGTRTIKEKKIASRTVQEYFIEKGMDEPVIESLETYDENGQLTEIKEFDNKGDLKRWEKYTYDDDGNEVEVISLNAKGKLEKREVNIYSEGLRVEKQFYNQKDRLVKRKVYEYEFRD